MATSHGGEFVPTGPTHGLAYEPDKFAVKTILAVPIAVIVTGVVAFFVTDLIFSNIFAPKAVVVPVEVPAAAERNAVPMNERFARMSSTDPKAEVQQPRLEAIQQKRLDPSGRVNPEMITAQPTKEGNSPFYHAEDLRPERVAATSTASKDPVTGIVRVPVNQAIEMALDPKNPEWVKAFAAREGALPLDTDPRFGWDRPKESNGGNARPPAVPTPAKKAEPEKKAESEKK